MKTADVRAQLHPDADDAHREIEAAKQQYEEYRRLNSYVLVERRSEPPTSTRFSWSHPLGLVIK